MDRFEIYRDVSYSMQESVIDNTLFDRSNYHTGIVPNAAPMDGFKADLPFWAVLLKDVEHRLHVMNERYRVLRVTINDAKVTLSKPLGVANALLTQKIWEGNQPPVQMPQFESTASMMVALSKSKSKTKAKGKSGAARKKSRKGGKQ